MSHCSKFHTPLSSTNQFNTKRPLLFSPQNSSVQHQKPLSTTPNTPQLNRPLSSTHPSVKHKKTEGLNWGVFGAELRRFMALKRCGPCVELMCWILDVELLCRKNKKLICRSTETLPRFHRDWNAKMRNNGASVFHELSPAA